MRRGAIALSIKNKNVYRTHSFIIARVGGAVNYAVRRTLAKQKSGTRRGKSARVAQQASFRNIRTRGGDLIREMMPFILSCNENKTDIIVELFFMNKL